MEHTKEHTSGSSYNEVGSRASSIKLNWAPVPHERATEKQSHIKTLGLGKYAEVCKDQDNSIALEAIHNYNETTKKTQV